MSDQTNDPFTNPEQGAPPPAAPAPGGSTGFGAPPPPPGNFGAPAAPPASGGFAAGSPGQPGGFGAPPPPPNAGPPAYQPPPQPGGFGAPPPPPNAGPPAYQPPPQQGSFGGPPPAGTYAAPPAPAQGFGMPPQQGGFGAPGGQPVWGSTGGTGAVFDPKTVDPMDWGIIGAGVLAFIFSLFDYYVGKYKINGVSHSAGSVSAWHGFFGWFAAVVALLGSAALAAEFFAPGKVKLPIPTRVAAFYAFALATLCVLLAFFVHPGAGGDFSEPGFSAKIGHGFSYFVSVIVIIAGLVLSFLRLQATGGSLPWQKSSNAR